MNVDKEKAKKAVEGGTFFSFIPHRLEIVSRPEFNNFPFNVLFMKKKAENEKIVTGTALYEPDFYTFEKKDNVYLMRYHNAYGGNCHLVVAYDEIKKKYHGQKYINGKLVGSADGGDNWNLFFIHFTMLGLSNGERCQFENIEKEVDKNLPPNRPAGAGRSGLSPAEKLEIA